MHKKIFNFVPLKFSDHVHHNDKNGYLKSECTNGLGSIACIYSQKFSSHKCKCILNLNE